MNTTIIEALFTFLLVAGIPLLVTIVALIDILKSEFHPERNKIIWVIVVLVAPLIGSILYLFIGRDQKRKSQATN
tara:strand:- start:567 stop:791 length:225 start_codon:yes stop_codon:yes gene_type:complete